MNLARRIKQAEVNLNRKRAEARKAKASDRAGIRFDVNDLEDALSRLREQQQQQEAW